ncbi:TPA: hypothetical protein N0F65_003157 [Lagenidium giganteum]|uniref:RING-type E3 ubiquitin transferase n=1 Tax=Lagenidium giganteum TaxID=4803 RepID=A0AAV2ZC92_9STRA|nr:TPA: hypothetical protein N0F65_003157 [Lagenidium giganteum]
MLKPVTLACGHSFCQHCLELWLRNCQSCPSCRQQVDRSPQQLAVNRALQDVMTTFYPAQVREMEARDSADRLQRLRELIVKSIESGKAIRELIATEQAAIDGVAPGATVAMVLDNDVNLHERLLAIETRERLRKDKLLREASRKRHMLAYCSIVPSAPSPPTAASSSQTRTSVVTSKLASIRKFSPGTSSTRGKRGHFANVLGRKK